MSTTDIGKETTENVLQIGKPDLRANAAARPDCREPETCRAKTPGKHCSACSLSAKWKDSAFREKRAQAYRDRLANDPEFRAAHCARGASHLAGWRSDPDNRPGMHEQSRANLTNANTPEFYAARTERVRQIRFAGIPRDRWDEYRKLARQMPAAEARAIIEAEVPGTAEHAKRSVANAALTMQLKHEREVAGRY